MLIARTLFILCSIFCLLFFSTQVSNLHISTDLKDLSPDIAATTEQQDIIDSFSNNIQQRFILYIRSKNKRATEKAALTLSEQLNLLPQLSVNGENPASIKKMLDTLKPFQHQLLSPSQAKSVEEKGILQLRNEAEKKLYQFDSAVRLLPFDEDPLGYFNDYIFSLLSNLSNTQSHNEAQETDGYESTTVSVSIKQTSLDLKTQTHLFNKIKAIEEELEQEFSVDILHSGLFFFAAEAAISSKADVELISMGSTICIIFLLLFVFRSIWPLLLPMFSVTLGVAFATALTYSFYQSLHILTIVFGASLIGIVIDYSLHFFYHHIQHDKHKKNHAHTHLYKALLLSLLTSIIGYSALGLSDLAALRKIALFSGCGLFMAWLTVIVLGQYMLRSNIKTENIFLPKLLACIHLLVPKSKNTIVICFTVLLLTLVGMFYLKGFNTSDDPRLFYRVSKALISEEKTIQTALKQYEPGRFFIIQGQNQDQVRRSVDTLKYNVHKTSPNAQLHNILDATPSTEAQAYNYSIQNKIYKADDGVIALLYKQLGIPTDRAENLQNNYLQSASRELKPLTLTQAIEGLIPTWFENDNSMSTIVLISQGSDTTSFPEVAESLQNVSYINSIDQASDVLKQQRISAANILLLAFILIGILLLLYYRTLSSLLTLLVPASAIIVTLLYLLFSQDSVTLFHIMALFLVLGLGMDYVIFSKEMTAQRETTQKAILLSALTTSVSFGFLSISSIPIAQSFGLTILIGNTANLFGALIYSNTIYTFNHS